MFFLLLLLHRIVNITFLLSAVVGRRKEFSGEILFEVKSCFKCLNLLEMLILILFFLLINSKWTKKLIKKGDYFDWKNCNS